MKIGEFFATLGFEVDEKGIKSFGDKVKELPKKVDKVGAALVLAIPLLERFTRASQRSAAAINNFSRQTGLSTIELQKWQNAAQLSNLAISADEVTDSIKNLEQNIAQVKLGLGDATPFKLLGVDPRGGAFSVLEQLRGSLDGGDRAFKVNLLQQMGISPEMVNVLSLSRKEFDRLSGTFTRTKEDTKALEKLGLAVRFISLQFTNFKNQISAAIAPALTKIFEILGRVFTLVGDLASGIADLTNYFIGLFTASTGTASALRVVGAALLFVLAPLAPILAGLAAILLVMEDIQVFRSGGSSIFGRLVAGFKLLSTSIGVGMLKVFNTVRDFLMDQIIKPITEFIPSLREAAEGFGIGDADANNSRNYIGRGGGGLFEDLDNYINGLLGNNTISRSGANITNIMNVTTTADAEETANIAVRKIMQASLNTGLADINTGAVN